MATERKWGKRGLTLSFSTDKRPVPKVRIPYPLPDFGTETSPLIQVSLETLDNVPGIRVTTISPEGLPKGFRDAQWSLQHTEFSGLVAPNTLTWESIPISAGPLSLFYSFPSANATHRFRVVQHTIAPGSVAEDTVYPFVAIVTPMDYRPPTWEEFLAIGDDGILHVAEKPRVVIDYETAQQDATTLLAKAAAAGVPATDFGGAWSALRNYILSLTPAYNNLTANTPVSPETWRTVWRDFRTKYTELLVRIAGAPPSKVKGLAASNIDTSLVSSVQKSVPGYIFQAGELAMLAGQTTPAQNGIYRVTYTPAQGSDTYLYPPTQSTTGTGFYSNQSYSTDGTSSAPNTTTFGTMGCAAVPTQNSMEVVFSGWTGTGITGTLTIDVDPDQIDWLPEGGGSIVVSHSLDAGATWTTDATFETTASAAPISVPLSGIAGSQIRVKIQAFRGYHYYWEWDTLPDGRQSRILVREYGAAVVRINSVHVLSSAQGTATWGWQRVGGATDGGRYFVERGGTYGGKTWEVAIDGSNNYTLVEATGQVVLPTNAAGFLYNDGNGILSFQTAVGGTTWGTITGNLGDQTDLVNFFSSTFAPAAHAHTFDSLTGIPSTFTPAAHTHGNADLTGLASASVNYAASAGNADTLDGNHASAFSLAGHGHSVVGYIDTRSTNIEPFAYPGVSIHLKSNATDGLADGGTYHGVLNVVQWSDASGGSAHQIGLTDNGNLWHRVGQTAAGMGAWKKLIDSSNIASQNVNSATYLQGHAPDENATGATIVKRLSGGGIRATDFFVDGGWVRLSAEGRGLYCPINRSSFYQNASGAQWVSESGSGFNLKNLDGANKGWLYFDGDGFGLLNSAAGWSVRCNPGGGGGALYGNWGVVGNLDFSSNYGNGIVGLYASTRYQQVYAMGGAYTMAADGTSLNNFYGIAWTHSNVGGQSISGLEHQALFCTGGVTHTAIGTGVWTRGAVSAWGNITAYASDRRLKENIEVIPDALEKVKALHGVTYQWNTEAQNYLRDDGRRHAGVLAQEVQAVLPEAVCPAPFDVDGATGQSRTGQNYLTVQNERLVALLIEAVKELSAKVDRLEAEAKR